MVRSGKTIISRGWCRKRCQMAIVYAVLIAVVVGALVAMQAYFKRALQAKYKAAGDVYGEGMLYRGKS